MHSTQRNKSDTYFRFQAPSAPTSADLKRDPERLHQAAELLEAENQKLIDTVMALQARIDALEGRNPGRFRCGSPSLSRS
jgi:hypothetical protein